MPSIFQLILSFVQSNPAAINMAVQVLEAFLAHLRLELAKHEEALKMAAHAAQPLIPAIWVIPLSALPNQKSPWRADRHG